MSPRTPPTASSWPPSGSSTAGAVPTPMDTGENRASRPDRGLKGHIGLIVSGSIAAGWVVALLLVAAPFIPAQESRVTGAVLCGFAAGWLMLAVLSVRYTDQPQRWAAAPALLMGLGGLLLVAFGSSVQAVLRAFSLGCLPAQSPLGLGVDSRSRLHGCLKSSAPMRASASAHSAVGWLWPGPPGGRRRRTPGDRRVRFLRGRRRPRPPIGCGWSPPTSVTTNSVRLVDLRSDGSASWPAATSVHWLAPRTSVDRNRIEFSTRCLIARRAGMSKVAAVPCVPLLNWENRFNTSLTSCSTKSPRVS